MKMSDFMADFRESGVVRPHRARTKPLNPTPPRSKPISSEPARPFSIRLTAAEKAMLERRAGRRPLGAFIRATLLGESAERRSERQSPIKDGAALGRVLAALGQSGVAKSLNELAQQAAIGVLYLDAGTTARLRQASDDIVAMRLLLLEALGKEISRGPRLARKFNSVAMSGPRR
jgi:hypothetical protein